MRQIVFFTQEGLVSADAGTGDVLWRYDYRFNVSTAASPIVAGDLVYCSAGYGVGAGLVRIEKQGDSFSANEVWRKRNKLVNHWSTPVHKDGYHYGMFSFKKYGEGPLKCVRLSDGEIMWEKEGFGPGNVVLVRGHLVALGDAGQLVVVEATPNAYREVARADVVGGKCWSTPAVIDDRIYVRSTTEAICLDVSPRLTAR